MTRRTRNTLIDAFMSLVALGLVACLLASWAAGRKVTTPNQRHTTSVVTP